MRKGAGTFLSPLLVLQGIAVFRLFKVDVFTLGIYPSTNH